MFSEIIITVTDVDAAAAFYTDVCRFKQVRSVTHEGATVVELDADGQRITLLGGDEPGVRLVMDTENIRADYRRLNRLNVPVDGEPADVVGGAWLPFADPAGNPLAYWKPAEPSDG